MYVFGSGRRGRRVGERIWFRLYQVLDVCLCLGSGGVGGEWVGGLDLGLDG